LKGQPNLAAKARGDAAQGIDGRVDSLARLQFTDRPFVDTRPLGELSEGQPLPLALCLQRDHHAAHLPVGTGLHGPLIFTGGGELVGPRFLPPVLLTEDVEAGLLLGCPLDLPLLALDGHRFLLPFLGAAGGGASYAVIG